MFWQVIKVIFVIGLVIAIGWGGVCGYANFCAEPANNSVLVMPEKTEAPYSVLVHNTNNLLLVSDYEVFGTEVGKRKYVLHGFWEVQGKDFIYKNIDLILNESIFGEITISAR